MKQSLAGNRSIQTYQRLMTDTEETITRCPHCNASMKQYWHRLTPLLVSVLIKFRNAVSDKGVNEIHVPKELPLSTTEYNNFQKLRFHGLVAKVRISGVHKSGYWLLTHRGSEFLKGTIEIPAKVLTFRNEVIDRSERLVGVKGVLGSAPFLETIETIEYKFGDNGQGAFI